MRFSKDRKHVVIAAALSVAILSLGTGAYLYMHRSPQMASIISDDIRSMTSFRLYVPTKLPDGFQPKKDSVHISQDVVFLQFEKDDQIIFVSQQAKPEQMTPLTSLKGFSPLEVKAGEAVTGEQDGTTAVIVVTDSSMITITGGETISRADLGLIAKRLQAIN